MLRVCVDLDGTICELASNGDYASVRPQPGAQQALREMKRRGAYIIIYTARRMRTHRGDVAKVVEDVGDLTRAWLREHDIPYDELVFGKPYAHAYIDDLAYRFDGWFGLSRRILKEFEVPA
jgi:capsule biosynthesis phosphatase